MHKNTTKKLKKIPTIINSFLKKLFVVVSISLLFFSPVINSSTNVYAAASNIDSTEKSLGNFFQECRVGTQASPQISSCLRQIVNFFFVVAVFAIIFRVVAAQLNIIVDTTASGDGPIIATKNAIRDGIIGLLLLGAPVLFLNLLNESTTQLLFDFKSPTSDSGKNGESGNGTEVNK